MDPTAPALTRSPDTPPPAAEPQRLRWAMPLLGAVLFAAGAWVLVHELRGVRYGEVRKALRALPAAALWASVALTLANYAVLTLFDLLAFRYIGRAKTWWKVMAASFTGYAISNSVGWALISGTSVRYRFYSRWGLTAGEISRIVVFYSGTFWLGLLVLGGASLAFDPHPELLRAGGGVGIRVLGAALLALAAAYAVAAAVRRTPLRAGRFEVPFPPVRTVAAQFLLSTVDWALAAGVLYVLLPRNELTFAEFLSAFLAAQLAGLISHVPGGVGVFEGSMALLLRPYLSAEQLVSSLVLYRIVYYLVPLALALAFLVADEVRLRMKRFAGWGSAFGALTGQMVPKVLAAFTFVAGTALLFSGATPGQGSRLRFVTRLLPLGVIEASHFIGSIAGVALLIVSNGVARRLDTAFWFACLALAVGITASLLKGGDYEEAILLAALVGAMVASRPAFDRKGEFFAARFSPSWVIATLAVVGATLWLGTFAFRHVEYSGDLWWRFAANAEAPRALRASVGVMVVILAFGVLRMLSPAPPEVTFPGDDELEEAGKLIARQPSTVPLLVYLRDKSLLFTPDQRAFLMYGVQGKTWVAMGDPVGEKDAAIELVRQFVGRCDDFGGVPVFYQVPKESLHRYADFGLTFAKLGEEAYVDLAAFSLDGAERKPFRLVLNRFGRSGLGFRIVPPGEVPPLLPRVREVSADWLARRGVAEKGFSLGFYSDEYVSRFPLAIVESEGRMEAFATVWPGPDGSELSVDLMRFREDAPKNVMEALLLHLMLWGKERGYRRFNLGMAPLSGLEMSAVAPAWTRVGTFLFQRGGALYNFQGLRTYKEKFHPVWEPRYLAYPGGLALPRITADVSALVAGGYRRIFRLRGGGR